MKKRSRIPFFVLLIFILSVVIISLTINIPFLFKKSSHDDAKRYATRHCLVFYPNCDKGRENAKFMAKDVKENTIYDYSLIPYGDYYLVNYGNGYSFFVDKDNEEPIVNEVSDEGKRIISDYLRYTIKKEKNDLYYNPDFISNSYVDNLDFSKIAYDFDKDNLVCQFLDFEVDVKIPLKYIQSGIGMDFGYSNELYVKPTYIDDKHPVICLTFDDGPNMWYEPSESSSVRIVDTLYKNDANATFYVVGTCLQERDVWTDYEAYTFLKNSIGNGNEYGSHTHGHELIYEMSSTEKINTLIKQPADFLSEYVGYQMKTYRPPEGVINDVILEAQPFPAILWDVDSKDWAIRDGEDIYNKVIGGLELIDDGDIIIFHDIYDETADAIEKIVPVLIQEGYQLATVSDMLQSKNVVLSRNDYCYNVPKPFDFE